MRRCTGRAGAFVLALCCLAPFSHAVDDTDPGYGMPAPADAAQPAPADPDADPDEAKRLEGDAAGQPLSTDVNDANKPARDALQDALDTGASSGPRRSVRDAITDLSGLVSLSLDEAIRVGLERNLDLDIVRFDPYIVAEDIGIAWGAYDPRFANEFGYNSARRPIASVFITQDSVQTNTLDGQMGMTGLIPWWGASYEMGYVASRAYTTNSTTTLSPQFDANVFGRITMPLLKNLVWNQEWTRVKTSQVAFAGSKEEFRRQVMDVVQRMENAYWGVIATREQLRVAQKSLETARALLEQTRTQYEVGVVSKVEVTEAEAGVAQRDFDLIVAANAFRAAEDTLSDLVFGESLRPTSTYGLELTDAPADFTAFEVDPEEATKKAFANRPELAAIKLDIARQELQLKFARNQTLPQLDAVLGYGRLGQAGEINPAIFGSNTFLTNDPAGTRQAQLLALQSEASRSLSTANNDFFGSNTNNDFTARGVLSIPLGNQTATHAADKTAFELRKTVSRERRLEQDIVLGVRTAIRNLRSAQEGVFAAQRSVAAASEQLRAERIRLDNGESTPFSVLQRESDLVTAESGQINALRVYRTSTTDLDRAQGTILKTHRIKIDEVGALR